MLGFFCSEFRMLMFSQECWKKLEILVNLSSMSCERCWATAAFFPFWDEPAVVKSISLKIGFYGKVVETSRHPIAKNYSRTLFFFATGKPNALSIFIQQSTCNWMVTNDHAFPWFTESILPTAEQLNGHSQPRGPSCLSRTSGDINQTHEAH